MRGGGGSRWKTIADNGMCLKTKACFTGRPPVLVSLSRPGNPEMRFSDFKTRLYKILKRNKARVMIRPLIYLFPALLRIR